MANQIVPKKSKRYKTCIRCGADFFAWKTMSVFCSNHCSAMDRGDRLRGTGGRAVKNCIVCGVIFSPDRKTSILCSKKCFGIYHSKPKRKCAACFKDINHFSSFFCSTKCAGESKTGVNSPRFKGGRILIKCLQCEVQFIRDRPRNVFCSRKCGGIYLSVHKTGEQARHWKGGALYLSETKHLRKAVRKAYYKKTQIDPECIAKKKEYRQSPAGKDAKAKGSHARRVRIANNNVGLPPPDLKAVKAAAKASKWICVWCGLFMPTTDRSLDHIIPVSIGGTNETRNLRYLHKSCNSQKGATADVARTTRDFVLE